MFRLIQSMFARSTTKPARPNRRLTRGRVESLESRCMLSVTLLAADPLHFGRSEFNSGVVLNGIGNSNFGMPQSEFEHDGKRPTEDPPSTPPPSTPLPPVTLPPATTLPPVTLPPVTPPPTTLPAAPHESLPPPPPPAVDETEPPAEDGGPIEFSPTETEAAESPPPPDIAAERETRAVLQMLTKLQYSFEFLGADSMLEDAPMEGEFDGFLRDLASLTGERYDDADREGGAVAIAIQEVVAERNAGAVWNDSLESLHEVSVEMDRTSGRYQAFEVSTLEEGTPRAMQLEVSYTPEVVADEGTATEDMTDTAGELVSPAEEAPPAASGVPLSLVSPPVDDESAQMKWTSAVALVTLGIVLQFFRECKVERLRSHAAFAWQHLMDSPGWLRRRTKAERRQAAVE